MQLTIEVLCKVCKSKRNLTILELRFAGDCGDGFECKPREACPEFSEKRRLLRNLTKASPEYDELLADLKELVCNAKDKTVCCRANYEIIGGTVVTDVSEFPYMARIYIKTGFATKSFCGAALIQFNLLLSAKHCVDPFFWDNCIDEHDCYAVFRDINPGRTNHEKGEFRVPIVEVFSKEGMSDLAVLKLAYQVTKSQTQTMPKMPKVKCSNYLQRKHRSMSTLTTTWEPH